MAMTYAIRRCIKHGKPRVMLDIQPGPWGPRQRRFFDTEANAQTFVDDLLKNLVEHGKAGAAVGQEEAVALARWLRVFTLGQLEQIVQRAAEAKVLQSIRVEEAADRYYLACRQRGGQALHLSDVKSRLGTFKATFGARMMSELAKAQIEDWLDGLDRARETKRNHLKVLRPLFKYALDRGWVQQNPVAELKLEPGAKKAPAILSPAEMLALLAHADARVLPLLVCGGFLGLRTSEVLRLETAHVNFEENHLAVLHTKTSARGIRDRYVDLSEFQRRWLESLALPEAGRLVPYSEIHARRLLRPAIRKARLPRWPENGLRHSCCSYHLAAFEDAGKTAAMVGHTDPATTFASYRKLTTKKLGLAWFAITPEAVAAQRKSPGL